MRALTALSLLLLCACAKSQQVYLPDGSAGYSINCDGSSNSWSLCFQRAGQLCGPSGYEILERTGDTTESAAAMPGVFAVGANVTRSMLVRCGKPE